MVLHKIFIFIIIMGLSNVISAQTPSCCSASSVTEFANLGKDLSFVLTHEEPLPYVLQNPSGTTTTFPITGESDGQGYYIKGSKTSTKWIFVIQEWWGLNDYIRNEAEKLHKAFPDAHILALDMYDGKTATKREEAAALMQAAKPERLEKIILNAAIFAGKDAKIATIGWCFGGAWSNKAAVLLGEKAVATVMYYGMPVNDIAQLSDIKAPILGVFAEMDGWISPKVVEDFKSNMQKANKSLELHTYAADHAFANPSNPKFNKEFAEDAWAKSVAFIKKHL
jgi:carboxymethylenebutenolidase